MAQVFQPFRSIGTVCNDIPCYIQHRGNSSFIYTVIGKSFHLYSGDKMRLQFVGEQFDAPIKCIVAHGDYCYVACGSDVHACKRGKRVSTFYGHDHAVVNLMFLGDSLVTLTENGLVTVWNIADCSIISSMSLNFSCTAWIHPPTYLNKLVAADATGHLHVINVASKKVLWSGRIAQGNSSTSVDLLHDKPAGIVCLAASSVLDIIAAGTEAALIHLYNIRQATLLFTLPVSSGGIPTSLSFRLDVPDMLMAGTSLGRLYGWNLERREEVWSSPQPRKEGDVTTISCFPSHPLCFSATGTNRMQLWLMEGDSLRSLNVREGLPAAITSHLFCYPNSHQLITSSASSLYLASYAQDHQTTQFSEVIGGAGVKRKREVNRRRGGRDAFFAAGSTGWESMMTESEAMGNVVAMAVDFMKANEWANVLTVHANSQDVVFWESDNRRKVGVSYSVEEGHGRPTAVAIAPDGHTGVVGTSSGIVLAFNMQSGRYLKQLPPVDSSADAAHAGLQGSISTLHVNALSSALYVGTLEGWLYALDMQNGRILKRVQLAMPIAKAAFHPRTHLCACILDDCTIVLVDVRSMSVVRTFRGHSMQVNCVAFRDDGRWLVSAGADGTVRVWDILSASCVDWMRMEEPAVAIAFTKQSQFLLSAHAGRMGLCMWANRMLFSSLVLRSLPSTGNPPLVALPMGDSVMLEDNDSDNDSDNDNDNDSNASSGEDSATREGESSLPEAAPALLSLTENEGDVKWKLLIHMETIKERNKPVQPAKKPESAPFFLPVQAGLNPSLQIPAANDSDDLAPLAGKKSRILGQEEVDWVITSPWIRKLKTCTTSEDYRQFWLYVKGLSAAEIDVEIRSLQEGEELKTFVLALCKLLTDGGFRDFDMGQAILNVFLNEHGLDLLEDPEVVSSLSAIEEALSQHWTAVNEYFQYDLCLLRRMTQTED